MFRRCQYLLLCSLLSILWGASANSECDSEFAIGDSSQRQIELTAARNKLISHLSRDQNADIIAGVIRLYSASDDYQEVENAIWLRDLPAKIIEYSGQLELTEEMAWEIAEDFESEIDALEKKAICYHFTEWEYDTAARLMIFLLHDGKNDQDKQHIAFGYLTKFINGRAIYTLINSDVEQDDSYEQERGYSLASAFQRKNKDEKLFEWPGTRVNYRLTDDEFIEQAGTRVNYGELTDDELIEMPGGRVDYGELTDDE